MKVIGIRRSTFSVDDVNGKRDISGYNFYTTEPLEKGEGLAAERIYLTDEKLQKSGFVPQLGDEIEPAYNRYGKVDSIARIGNEAGC